ncbi:phosphotransferase enzyme family protein [Maribacter sp. 2307ULW6-5]|uniref:phosphotransferase enzyme family protein n=1 Tax=Maribacter sp. 2307ULW6-5 TaxID=3386275 RepID=UPI0039BC9691
MGLKNYDNTPEELRAILGSFYVPHSEALELRPLTTGFINDTYLVHDAQGPKFILQRINHKVFANVDGLMGNVSKALERLKADDYKDITLLKTKEGTFFLPFKNSFWRLMEFVDDSVTYDNATTPQIAFEAGRVLGNFHRLMQHADPADYVDTIPLFHDLSARIRQFGDSLIHGSETRLDLAKPTIDSVQGIYRKLKKMDLNALPLRVCHNDTKLNNILFSRKTGLALCLIDLDTIMAGRFLFDFGDAVRTIANTAAEDERDLGKIGFDRPLFEAFVKGLKVHGSFLTEEEVASLPLGAVLMPFLHGLRALTDYLNNDVYYRVSYETQNLDRAMSLLDCAQKTLHELPFMESCVRSHLGHAG